MLVSTVACDRSKKRSLTVAGAAPALLCEHNAPASRFIPFGKTKGTPETREL